MALPEQIRRQLEQVEALTNTAQPTGEASTVDTTPANPAEVTQVQPVTQAHNAEQPVSNVIPIENASAPSEDWQQKYRTLQGKYDSEVPRLTQQLRELSAQTTSLQQLLANLNAPSTPQQGQPTQKLVTDKDVTEYGMDTIDLVRRVTREELAPLIARFEQQLSHVSTRMGDQVQQVSTRQHLTAEQTFFMQLGQTVPNWRETNANPQFRAWLAEVDPLTGINRQTYLDDARQHLDVSRVASIFAKWRSEAGGAPASQPARVNPASELETQISPGRSRAEATPVTATTQTKRQWTRDDVSKFYNDVRRGIYDTRKPERDQIERDIFEAQRDKRLV